MANPWAPEITQATIAQVGRFGNLVRLKGAPRKTIPPRKYLGYVSMANGPATPWVYNRAKLAAYARYWALALNDGDRSAWDALAFGTGNGFDKFVRYNTTVYRASTISADISGQNYGDVLSSTDWTFDPPQPLAPASIALPDVSSYSISFNGSTPYEFSNVQLTIPSTSNAKLLLLYSTRPWSTFWDKSTNPLIRIGCGVYHPPNSLWFPEWPAQNTALTFQELWKRVIGGGVAGQNITTAVRFILISATGAPGPLLVQNSTIL